MPSSQVYPDFSRVADEALRQQLKLLWDQVNSLRDQARTDFSSFVPNTREVRTVPPLLGGGSLADDLVLRLRQDPVDTPEFTLVPSVVQSIPNNLNTEIVWGTQYGRSAAEFHSPAITPGKVFIGNKPGAWLVAFQMVWDLSPVVGVRRMALVDGTGQIVWGNRNNPAADAATSGQRQTVTGLLFTAGPHTTFGSTAGAFVSAQVFQSSGGAINTLFNGNRDTRIEFLYLGATARL